MLGGGYSHDDRYFRILTQTSAFALRKTIIVGPQVGGPWESDGTLHNEHFFPWEGFRFVNSKFGGRSINRESEF